MFIYCGDYWVPFPATEYGGSWVVIAENDEQCIDILRGVSYDSEYDDLIPAAVTSANKFQLDENVISNRTARLVDKFFT